MSTAPSRATVVFVVNSSTMGVAISTVVPRRCATVLAVPDGRMSSGKLR